MIITPKIQGTGVLLSLGRRSAPWVVALAVGASFAACSGSIETPTDEYPTRSNAASNDDDDDDATAAADDDAPARPAARPQAQAASDDDDEPAAPPAASDDDEDEPPVQAPAADEDEPAAPPAGAGATTVAFEADVWPIFNTACAPCHAGSGFGGNDIGDPDVATAFEESTRVAARVVARIENGGMPPACGGGAPGDDGCVTEEELEIIEAWIEAGTPE